MVLQPLPVAGDTGDLLAVEVRHRVTGRGVGGVNTVLLDPGEELALLLYNAPLSAISHHPIRHSSPREGAEGYRKNPTSITHHSHRRLVLALDQVKHGVAQARADDPAHGGAPEGDEAQRQDRVEGDLASEGVGGA